MNTPSEAPSENTAVEVEVIETIPEPLHAIAVSSGLEVESSKSIEVAFAPLFAQAEDWKRKVESINITSVEQVREMKLARETRLALREIRIKTEHTRKSLKEDSVRRGRAVDGMANVLKFLIEPLEEKLLEQEQFAERQEANRKEALRVARSEILVSIQVDPALYQLGDMTEETFQQLVEGTKLARAAAAEAALKAEAQRIAAAAAEAAERERVRQENELLRQQAAEKQAQLEAERAKAAEAAAEKEKELEAERTQAREAAAEKEKQLLAIQAKAMADAQQAAKEKAEVQAAAAKKAKAEKEAREKAEAELKAVRQAAADKADQEAKAEMRRRLAPEREKLAAFAATLRGLQVPEMTSPTGEKFAGELKAQIEKFAAWVEKGAEAL